MTEDEKPEKEEVTESEFPLHSDFERLAIFLLRAQNLGVENSNYNPSTLREYYSVLREVWRMVKPITSSTKLGLKVKSSVEELNEVTRICLIKMRYEDGYKVPMEVFEKLDELHDDLLQLKQDANLGIRVRTKMSETEKLRTSIRN